MGARVITFLFLFALSLPAAASGYATLLLGQWDNATVSSAVQDLTFRNDSTFQVRLYDGLIVRGTYSIERGGRIAMALDNTPDVAVQGAIWLTVDNNRLTIKYRHHAQHFARTTSKPVFVALNDRR